MSEVVSLEAALTAKHEGIIAESYGRIAESTVALKAISNIYKWRQLEFDYTGLDTHPDLREAW